MGKKIGRETIQYLIFGVLTTVVNYIVFELGMYYLEGKYVALIANIIAFVIAASFAYVTNKKWVFQSKSWSFGVIKKELPSFFGARLFTLLLEELGLYLTYAMHWDKVSIFGIQGISIAKLALQVLVVALNYFFSKFFIFKKKPENS